MHLQFKPGIATGGESLTAHLLQVTVDRLNRMAIRAQFDGVHKPGVRTYGRPAHRDQAHPRLRQDARCISGAVAANNYSPLRPTAAPRRAGQTHLPVPPPVVQGRTENMCDTHFEQHQNAVAGKFGTRPY